MERGGFVKVSLFPGKRNMRELLDGEEAYLCLI
jgi:hypothetical protein